MELQNLQKNRKAVRLPPLGRQQAAFAQLLQPNPQKEDDASIIQQKKQQEKNLTDGDINLPPDANFYKNEKFEEISFLDTRDTIEGLALQIDEKSIDNKSISYYIENIQKQNFQKASQQQSEQFEQQKDKKQQELMPENIEDKLFSIRNDINSSFSKMAQYIQGFLSGLIICLKQTNYQDQHLCMQYYYFCNLMASKVYFSIVKHR